MDHPHIPLRVVKGDWNGVVSRNNRKKGGHVPCWDGYVKEPYGMSMAWEPSIKKCSYYKRKHSFCILCCGEAGCHRFLSIVIVAKLGVVVFVHSLLRQSWMPSFSFQLLIAATLDVIVFIERPLLRRSLMSSFSFEFFVAKKLDVIVFFSFLLRRSLMSSFSFELFVAKKLNVIVFFSFLLRRSLMSSFSFELFVAAKVDALVFFSPLLRRRWMSSFSLNAVYCGEAWCHRFHLNSLLRRRWMSSFSLHLYCGEAECRRLRLNSLLRRSWMSSFFYSLLQWRWISSFSLNALYCGEAYVIVFVWTLCCREAGCHRFLFIFIAAKLNVIVFFHSLLRRR